MGEAEDSAFQLFQETIQPRFELSSQLGKGSMGMVYRAIDRSLNRDVAIKFLNLQAVAQSNPGRLEEIKTRFNREARLAAQVNHPHIVQIYEAHLDEEFPYFVMEYLDGVTLSQRRREPPQMSHFDVCKLMEMVCSALDYALRTFNMIHRDLKPANIMITNSGVIKVVDLGLAKITAGNDDEPSVTQVGTVMGTPYYMAPEQIQGRSNLDHRTDIYAIGIILYELLTNERAFEGTTKKEMYQAKWNKQLQRLDHHLPQAPVTLVNLLDRMLEPKIETRCESYEEIINTLNEVAQTLAPEADTDAFSAVELQTGSAVTDFGLPPNNPMADLPTADENDVTIVESSCPATVAAATASSDELQTIVEEAPGTDETISDPEETVESPVVLAASEETEDAVVDDGLKIAAADELPEPSGDYVDFLPGSRDILERIVPGTQLGRYKIVERIGVGGMGVVYRAVDTASTDAREVAVKVLIKSAEDADEDPIKQFRREARVISAMSHNAIVKVLDIDHDKGFNFFVMELFLGPHNRPMSLLDYAAMYDNKLDEQSLRDISVHLLDAIAYSHRKEVVHCDIKPANILFAYTGDDQADAHSFWLVDLKLTDFGLAKIIGEELVLESVHTSMAARRSGATVTSDASALLGTYDYMSPEQRRGDGATAQSDLFAVGLILFRMLTGHQELGLKRPSELRPGIDRQWDNLIFTALEEEAENRFQSATEMSTAIAAIRA